MKVIHMSFIPRLAVAAVAGFALVAPAAAFAETPTPTPSAEATATATASVPPSETPSPSVTPSVTPTTTPSVTPSATPSATPTPTPSATATLPPLTKFEGPNLTRQGCDVRVEYAIDPAVRIELFRSVNGGDFEQQFHPNWYWTDTYQPGDTVTWELRYNGETRSNSIEIPDPCDAEPTPTPTPSVTPTPTTTPTAAPRGVVTAKYECGAAHFTNNGTQPVTVYAGTVDSDSIEAKFDLAPGKSRTVESTTKDFGWIAWENGVQEGEPAGYLGAPGEDLSCDEPDDSVTPTPKPGESRGLANTGGEDGKDGEDGKPGTTSTSITITINGTKISITAPGNGKPIITTNGETVTPAAPPTPTPSATPTETPAVPAGDSQDDEIAEQQGEPEQGGNQDEQAVADEIFRLTNEFRAKEGLAPFERSECLEGTADGHAVTMATTGYRHATQDEMAEMVQTCPGFVGENIATGYEDAQEVFHAWETSTDGHREAMLSTTETTMGVGVEYKDGKPFYVQHFGKSYANGTPAAQETQPAAATPEASPTGLKAEEGLTPAATNLLRSVHQKWPSLNIGGVGQRPGESDHPSGNAIDIMTGDNSCSPVGQEVADWAKTNAEQLDVKYVIWCEKIWSVERASEGWRPNTGHQDHVHISVNGDVAARA